MSRKLRQRLVAVFEHAATHGHITINPAGEVINGALTRQKAVKAHFRALPYKNLPEALRTIRASRTSKTALQFLVLTAARSGEGREARWSKIEGDVWKIPAERMKSEREHRVPLSQAALDVLEQARELDDGSGLIFPSPMRPGRPMSNMTLTMVLRDNGLAENTTVHGSVPASATGAPIPQAEGDCRGRTCPQGRRRRGRLFPFGPVRPAAAPDGFMGGVCHWFGNEGCAAPWMRQPIGVRSTLRA